MSVSPGASHDAVLQLVADHRGPGSERQVSTDQANVSIAVDETYLVKWFRTPIAADDLVVLQHLASVSFAHTPRYVGPIVADDGVRAVVSEFVADATDGWQWYVADVLAWLDGEVGLDELCTAAAEMGRITAELHACLALLGTESLSMAALRRQIRERRKVAFAYAAGDDGERLRARQAQIDAALDGLDRLDVVPMQRVHGDLHAGQFLRSGNRLLLVDFDGDPMTETTDRLARQPVERDLAGLLQSLDHVGRVAAKRHDGSDVSQFTTAAIDAALCAYRSNRAVDLALLWSLRVAQELHEFAYASLRLPIWIYVPDAAMCALFPRVDAEAR